MASSRANVTLKGDNAEALREYLEEDESRTKAEAVRHFFEMGVEAERSQQLQVQTLPDGGIVAHPTGFDRWLEQIATYSGFTVIVALVLWLWETQTASIEPMLVFFFTIALGAIGMREYRRIKQSGSIHGE